MSHRTEADGCDPFPPDEMEDCWKKFMIGFLTRTAENCLWLAGQHRLGGVVKRSLKPDRRAYADRVYSCAVSWRWAMDGHASEITLEEVCEWVGVTPDRVRSGIVATCGPYEDINNLANQAIDELHEKLDAPVKNCVAARLQRACTPIDWAPLTKAKSEGLILCHPTRRRKSISTRSRRRTYST